MAGRHGGRREGAGKPKGSKNRATLEKQKVLSAFNQRVMGKADALFNAQYTLAVGSMKIFRIDEEKGENGKVKRKHIHVTDADEIKALLDEHDGNPGVVDGVYYYFTDVSPDNRAIDSMMNRTFGKPTEKVEHAGLNGDDFSLVSIGIAHLRALREEFKAQLDAKVISEDHLLELTSADTGVSREDLLDAQKVLTAPEMSN